MMDIELIDSIYLYDKPVIHDVIQRSDEWFEARKGKATSSKYPMLMTKDRKEGVLSDTKMKYLIEKACEIMTGESTPGFTNQAMEWGTNTEPEAVANYELMTMTVVEEIGFVELGAYSGDSPDGFTHDRAIEIKCPNSTTHFSYYLDPSKLEKAYKWQCYGHMLALGLDKCDLVSYDPRFKDDNKKMVIVTIEKNEKDMDYLKSRIIEFSKIIESMVA